MLEFGNEMMGTIGIMMDEMQTALLKVVGLDQEVINNCLII